MVDGYNPVPVQYRKSAPTLVNVNFTDLITNNGILELFGGKTADNYLLSSFVFYSNADGKITFTGDNTAGDIDFDALIENQITLEGKGIVTVPLLHIQGGGATSDVDTTMTVLLRKWDGSTETEIVSENVSANSLTTIATDTSDGYVWTVDFTIPRTVFKAGETLRITVTTTAPGASKEIGICHDPKDRDTLSGGNNVGSSGDTHIQPDTTVLTALLSVPLDI